MEVIALRLEAIGGRLRGHHSRLETRNHKTAKRSKLEVFALRLEAVEGRLRGHR